MNIKSEITFDTVACRIVYGLKLICPDNALPVFRQLIDKLYEQPALLGLSEHVDEAWEWHMVNNTNPELDKVYQSVYKTLYEFYKFLYFSALHGEISGDYLQISIAKLKEYKSAFKPQYQALLSEVGIEAAKDKTDVTVTADNELLKSLNLLAQRVPTNVNKWTPFVLANFVCCSFDGDFSYLIERTDALCGLDGLLFELRDRCLAEGYEQEFGVGVSSTSIDYNIIFKNKIGGFGIGYRSRKYQQFFFGTINGIGEKAMLEDFENLDGDLKEHFIGICRTCNSCMGCTKSGKNKAFTVCVTYGGKEYSLCPQFPRHGWDTLDRELIDVLFKYHVAQEKYGID